MKLPFTRTEGDAWFTIEDEVEKALGIPVVGQIPLVEEEGLRLIKDISTFSPLMEAYRWLRVNIQCLTSGNPVRSLAVVSAMPKEGKSTLIANLAMAFALDNKSVIIVDSDMRRPTLHKLFRTVDARPGLVDVIVGTHSMEEVLHRTAVRNLSLVPVGACPPNPAELIGSSAMGHLLEALEQSCDILLLDSPPTLVVADAMVLTARATHTLLVIGTKEAPLTDAKRALTFLNRTHANVVGVALNRMTGRGGLYYPSEPPEPFGR